MIEEPDDHVDASLADDGDGPDDSHGRGRPPGKAIRAHCLKCQGNSSRMVETCETMDCPLWAFRLGKRPDQPVLQSTLRYSGGTSRRAIKRMCVGCATTAIQATAANNASKGTVDHHTRPHR